MSYFFYFSHLEYLFYQTFILFRFQTARLVSTRKTRDGQTPERHRRKEAGEYRTIEISGEVETESNGARGRLR